MLLLRNLLQQVPVKSYMLIDAELHFAHKPGWPHFGFTFKPYPRWRKNLKPGIKCVLCRKPNFLTDRFSFRDPHQTSQQSVIIIKAHAVWRLDKPQTHNKHLSPECQQEKLNAFWLKRKALTETKRGSHSSADDVTVEMAASDSLVYWSQDHTRKGVVTAPLEVLFENVCDFDKQLWSTIIENTLTGAICCYLPTRGRKNTHG